MCGTAWEVYSTTINAEGARKCPCCGHRVEPRAWQLVKDAREAAQRAQLALAEGMPRFTVDYIDDSFYPNRERTT